MRRATAKKSFMIIGLGRFGANIAKILANMDADVLAIDIDEESVTKVASFIPHCVVADSTKPNVLKELGASQIDHAVVAIGNNLQASILTVLNLKNFCVKKITVRADEEGHKEVYRMLGATEVIIPEEATALSLANQIMSDSILDYYQLAEDYTMVKISVGEGFEPKSIIDMNVRVLFDVNIVGLIKDGKFAIPKPMDLISPGDVLVVVGTKENYMKFENFLNEKSRPKVDEKKPLTKVEEKKVASKTQTKTQTKATPKKDVKEKSKK
jgi:trk system potassium uptake protein TrkA